MIVFWQVKKTQRQISPSINVRLLKLISAVTSTMVFVIYDNNCRVGPKRKIWIRHNRILSILSDGFWISEKVLDSIGFGICHIPVKDWYCHWCIISWSDINVHIGWYFLLILADVSTVMFQPQQLVSVMSPAIISIHLPQTQEIHNLRCLLYTTYNQVSKK